MGYWTEPLFSKPGGKKTTKKSSGGTSTKAKRLQPMKPSALRTDRRKFVVKYRNRSPWPINYNPVLQVKVQGEANALDTAKELRKDGYQVWSPRRAWL